MVSLIIMNNKIWLKEIKNNFNQAASDYKDYCLIQKYFAKKIGNFIKDLKIPNGELFDFGSGTGLLADEIEIVLKRNLCRVDFCNNMLEMNKKSRKKLLWDLNNDLPSYIENCALIASNFCIHWLNEPEKILKNWFHKLRTGGYLIISYPNSNCFPEWKKTCKNNDLKYTGLNFPKTRNIINGFVSKEILFSENYIYQENYTNVYQLFRGMKNIGAQSTKSERTSVTEFKKLARYWPKDDKTDLVKLTWEINILIIKKI